MMKSSESRQVNRALVAAIAGALALGVGACGERQPLPSPERSGQNVLPGESTGSTIGRAADAAKSKIEKAADAAEQKLEKVGKAMDDAAVTAKVKSALIAEPNLKALSINVDTMAGIVILKGTADSHEAKNRAEQVASTIEGVRSVRNELIVVRG